jgi:hypothetical protein
MKFTEEVSEIAFYVLKHNSKVIRPDLSIWKGNQLVAVIEVKVSNGWKGKTMADHLGNRKKKIQIICPGVFFGAISFWNCFGKGIKSIDSEYIGLYEFVKDNNHKTTGKTIELMAQRFVGLPTAQSNSMMLF